MNISDVEKINETKKSKTKTSIRKQSTSLKVCFYNYVC